MPEFQERDRQNIIEFIRKHPLGMLTGTAADGKLVATHIPLLLQDNGQVLTLRGHVMRKTEYWKAFKFNSQVLVAFTGPNSPIQASWNQDRNFGGTYNYMAVHAHGTLKFLPQSDLLDLLRDLKNLFEEDPTAKFDSLTPEYVDALVPAIEAFEIQVTDLNAVFKLSQNRNQVDYDQTILKLTQKGGEAALVAEEMALRRSKVFPE